MFLNLLSANTQTIRPQQLMNCLSGVDHFAGLALKGLYLFTMPFKL